MRWRGVVFATLLAAAAGIGCGSGREAPGGRTLNWYVFNEPGGA